VSVDYNTMHKLCLQYRPLCRKGMSSDRLHKELGEMVFGTETVKDAKGKTREVPRKLKPNEVAAIVNYCYYTGDITTLTRLLRAQDGSPRL
jgi:hypothetical protein